MSEWKNIHPILRDGGKKGKETRIEKKLNHFMLAKLNEINHGRTREKADYRSFSFFTSLGQLTFKPLLKQYGKA